ncbi:MAG: hypothetical protein ACYCPP_00355 [Nitrososphaerales archaeon]
MTRLQGELSDFVLDWKKTEKGLGWKAEARLEEGLESETVWLGHAPKSFAHKAAQSLIHGYQLNQKLSLGTKLTASLS